MPRNKNKKKVQVITAGGAGAKKNQQLQPAAKKAPPPPPPAASASDSDNSVANLQTNNRDDIQQTITEQQQQLELERASDVEDHQTDEELAVVLPPPYKDNPILHNFGDDDDDDDANGNNNKQQHPSSPQSLLEAQKNSDVVWLAVCFFGIMASFVCYGLLLEYTTSGGRHLHELSFLFVTSGLYTLTAAAGRYVRDEQPTSIPPARFAILGLTSMGSTFCSVRSLRYVIYPIQVLAKSCKPVPVMIMGALMGKKYPARKYVNVVMIVMGVALFMGGGEKSKKAADSSENSNTSSEQFIGIVLLFVSLCFDGGTGAYEDKLMSVHSVQPFDLMYNIQLGKTILAGIALLVLNQMHIFIQMVQEMGFLLVALGLSGALGQIFIFVTIAKFGALTCSIIGLSRKVTTLVASIYFYGHHLNGTQFLGLCVAVGAMVLNFWGKKGGGGGHGGDNNNKAPIKTDETEKLVDENTNYHDVETEMTPQQQTEQRIV